jgi:hypothetical protein
MPHVSNLDVRENVEGTYDAIVEAVAARRKSPPPKSAETPISTSPQGGDSEIALATARIKKGRRSGPF